MIATKYKIDFWEDDAWWPFPLTTDIKLETLIVAETLFRRLKAYNPRLRLRLVEITETVMREE